MAPIDEQRSRDTRARAELALVRLLYALGREDVFLVVLGGLVPGVLASDEAGVPEHLGTTDVDVLLVTHVDPHADLGEVERALHHLGFKPDPNEDGWRWRGPIDGVPVKLEFLCDLPDYREGEVVRPSGCRALGAQNLRGTGYVARDFAWEALSGELPDGTSVTVRARFAGLEGYLLSKCVAVRTRAATKDYYDFAYVLQHNRAGGPEEAAHRLLNGEFAADLESLRSTFIEVRARYVNTTDSGPVGYAEQAAEVERVPTQRPYGPTPSMWSSASSKRLVLDLFRDPRGDTCSVIVNCAAYENGLRCGEDLDFRQAVEAARNDGTFAWLGLYEPTAEEFEAIAREFDLHELAVEDAIKAHQRPKVELYGDTLFVVVKTANYVDPEEVIEIGELMLFVNPSFIITVRHGEGDLRAVRERIERRPELLRHGSGMALYAILDHVVDNYEVAAQESTSTSSRSSARSSPKAATTRPSGSTSWSARSSTSTQRRHRSRPPSTRSSAATSRSCRTTSASTSATSTTTCAGSRAGSPPSASCSAAPCTPT